MGDSVEEVDDTSSADELAAQFMSRNVMAMKRRLETRKRERRARRAQSKDEGTNGASAKVKKKEKKSGNAADAELLTCSSSSDSSSDSDSSSSSVSCHGDDGFGGGGVVRARPVKRRRRGRAASKASTKRPRPMPVVIDSDDEELDALPQVKTIGTLDMLLGSGDNDANDMNVPRVQLSKAQLAARAATRRLRDRVAAAHDKEASELYRRKDELERLRRRNAQMLALQESQERDQRRRLELEAEATLRRQTSVTRTNLNVVVVYKSERQAFAVAPVGTLVSLFAQWRRLHPTVGPEDVVWTFKGGTVDETTSVSSLEGVSNGCEFVVTPCTGATQGRLDINIRLNGDQSRVLEFTMLPEDKFSTLIDKLASKLGVDVGAVKMENPDGDPLDPSLTPIDEDFEGGELLDARVP